MRVMIRLLVLILMGFTLVNCGYAAGGKIDKNTTNTKGANKEMKTYQMGRFAIDLPLDFKLAEQKHEFRLVEIEEIPIPPKQVSGLYAEQRWKERLAEIEKLTKPEGVKKIVVKQQTIRNLGHWSRGVLYYGDWMANNEGYFDILVDYGKHLTIFKVNGLMTEQESMFSWVMEVVGAYRPTTASSVTNAFHTKLGTIDLPYMEQESTYARFKGPMEVMLEIEMNEIHEDSAETGIINRTTAALAAGFANGIDVKKIRAKKRTAAGLPGEEEILQGDYRQEKNVSFDWEYLGASESGDRPMIQITMDTLADNLANKINMWDMIINSFRSQK